MVGEAVSERRWRRLLCDACAPCGSLTLHLSQDGAAIVSRHNPAGELPVRRRGDVAEPPHAAFDVLELQVLGLVGSDAGLEPHGRHQLAPRGKRRRGEALPSLPRRPSLLPDRERTRYCRRRASAALDEVVLHAVVVDAKDG